MANEVRLIDANALQEKLDWDNDIQRWTLYGIDDLDEMPTIDPESLSEYLRSLGYEVRKCQH